MPIPGLEASSCGFGAFLHTHWPIKNVNIAKIVCRESVSHELSKNFPRLSSQKKSSIRKERHFFIPFHSNSFKSRSIKGDSFPEKSKNATLYEK